MQIFLLKLNVKMTNVMFLMLIVILLLFFLLFEHSFIRFYIKTKRIKII